MLRKFLPSRRSAQLASRIRGVSLYGNDYGSQPFGGSSAWQGTSSRHSVTEEADWCSSSWWPPRFWRYSPPQSSRPTREGCSRARPSSATPAPPTELPTTSVSVIAAPDIAPVVERVVAPLRQPGALRRTLPPGAADLAEPRRDRGRRADPAARPRPEPLDPRLLALARPPGAVEAAADLRVRVVPGRASPPAPPWSRPRSGTRSPPRGPPRSPARAPSPRRTSRRTPRPSPRSSRCWQALGKGEKAQNALAAATLAGLRAGAPTRRVRGRQRAGGRPTPRR